eukprot:2708057-Amphidinium_carterae.1
MSCIAEHMSSESALTVMINTTLLLVCCKTNYKNPHMHELGGLERRNSNTIVQWPDLKDYRSG